MSTAQQVDVVASLKVQSLAAGYGLTTEQRVAADVAVALNKYRMCSPGELADGVTAALMSQVPPSVAIQALSAAIGKSER